MPRAVSLLSAALAGLAIVVGVILLAAISRNRDFQVDEVEHLHTAYSLRSGATLYRDVWQGHPPLLYCFLTPLTNVDDPIGTYHRGRLLTLAILLGTIALTSFCAWRVAGPWAATLACALALLHTTLIERGMEVRPDGPLMFLVMAALAIELRSRNHSLEALLLGSGVLLTQKAIFPLAAFACVWAFDAWRERRARTLLQPLAIALVPFAVALVVTAMIGNLQPFLRSVFLNAASAATRSQTRGTFGPLLFLGRESARNVAFVALALGGLVRIAVRRRGPLLVAFLAAFAVVALWLNPFPWPYVHVSFVPLLAIVAAVFVVDVVPQRFVAAAAAAAIVAAAATAIPRLVAKGAPATSLQFATLREIDRLTPRDATAFDLAGLYFRRDAYPVFAMSGDMLLTYSYGAFPRIVPELRRNAVACILYDYRTALLPPDVKEFIGTHFTHYGGNVFLPGTLIGAKPIAFEALDAKPFRYEGNGAITVDGAPFTRGVLARGMHRIDVVRASSPSRLVIDAPPPALLGPPSPELFRNFD